MTGRLSWPAGEGEDDVSRMMDLLYGWMLFCRDMVDLLTGDDLHDMLEVREPESPVIVQGLLAAHGHPHPDPVPAVCSVQCVQCMQRALCAAYGVSVCVMCSIECALACSECVIF